MIRFFGLKRPGGTMLSNHGAVAVVTFIWGFMIVKTAPMGYWSDVVPASPTVSLCSVVHIERTTLANYTIAVEILCFFIPLVITWIAYVGIIVKKWKMAKQVCS